MDDGAIAALGRPQTEQRRRPKPLAIRTPFVSAGQGTDYLKRATSSSRRPTERTARSKWRKPPRPDALQGYAVPEKTRPDKPSSRPGAAPEVAYRHKKKVRPFDLTLKRRLPTLPRENRSTIGVSELNFSVRNGKRWNLTAITT